MGKVTGTRHHLIQNQIFNQLRHIYAHHLDFERNEAILFLFGETEQSSVGAHLCKGYPNGKPKKPVTSGFFSLGFPNALKNSGVWGGAPVIPLRHLSFFSVIISTISFIFFHIIFDTT